MSQARATGPVGLFGGTFDPVHYGHLRTALELLEVLALAELRFLPAGCPPHRDNTHAPPELRLELVRAAIADEPRFVLDARELRRSGPSYTVDTLLELRSEWPGRPLCLVVGMDAYLGLPGWHRWQEIFTLAHLVVPHRPGWQAPSTGELGALLAARGTRRVEDLHEAPCGRVFVHAVTQLEISSSAIRALLRAGRDPRYLVPDSVCRLLADSGCYRAAAERN